MSGTENDQENPAPTTPAAAAAAQASAPGAGSAAGEETSAIPADTDSPAAAPPSPSSEGGRGGRLGTVLVLLVILLSLSWYLIADRYAPYTQQARVQGYIVGIAPKVTGLVTKVHVTNNAFIELNQPLFEIDSSDYEIALKRAESDLEKTRNQVGAGTAGVDSARAQLEVARAAQTEAQQDADRQERLYKEDPGAISVRRLEVARARLAEAQARVKAAQAEVTRAREQRGRNDEDNAQLQSALSAVEKARLDLENTVVRAPTGGVITDLRTDVGQFAGTGSPVMTLIAIHDVWINAEFTENNLGHIGPGSSAEIVFDSLPGQVFPGRVRSVGPGVSAGQQPPPGSLPTIKNDRDWLRPSQRFPVVIEFDPNLHDTLRGQLRAGGQADVIVYTDRYPLVRKLGELYIRAMSWLSYAY